MFAWRMRFLKSSSCGFENKIRNLTRIDIICHILMRVIVIFIRWISISLKSRSDFHRPGISPTLSERLSRLLNCELKIKAKKTHTTPERRSRPKISKMEVSDSTGRAPEQKGDRVALGSAVAWTLPNSFASLGHATLQARGAESCATEEGVRTHPRKRRRRGRETFVPSLDWY